MSARIVIDRRLRLGSSGLCVALAALAVAFLAAGADTAAAKLKQPACGKLQKQAKKAKGAKKRAAKRRLKQCKDDRMVYGQVKNSHFSGYRADGVQIDDLYCANGSWQADVGLGAAPRKTGWRVTDAKVRSKKRFTAVIEGKVPGGFHVIAIQRKGAKWLGGWEYFGEIRDPGAIEKRNGRSLCAKL